MATLEERIAELKRWITYYEASARDCRRWNDPMRYLPEERAADLRIELAQLLQENPK